jgi:protein involved in polysaccharide export with SLBB domain
MRKIYQLIILLSLPNFLFAQEINNDYLDSLPDEIKKDVLARANNDSKLNEQTFRSPKISGKLQKEEDLMDLKLRLEEDLLELERRLEDGEIKDTSKELKLFGVDFFDSMQTSFMPTNEPNLDSSYILDYGDILDIQLIGQKDSIASFAISREGAINLPDIGKIIISGLSLSEAVSLIKDKIKNTYIGTDAYITLSEIRDVTILVSGNAFNPGVYTLSGNSNILHAINVAGGINQFGSYRNIKLIRNNKVVDNLDLYDVLINGQFTFNKRLKTGDLVFVEPVSNIVTISGAVKRPAKYELNDGQNLYDAINYANGIGVEADLNNIYLERILDGQVKSLPIVNASQFKNIKVVDGDQVFIRKHPFRRVQIDGAIFKPGNYLMSEGDTINDLVKKAGGYTKNAYPNGIVYENKNALLINQMAKGVLYEEFLDNIIALSQQNPTGDLDFTSIINLTQDIKNAKSNGRVVVNTLDENPANATFVQDGDRVIVPERPNHIYIYGEVSSEGAILYKNNEEIDYYIKKSGGLKEYADNKAIYVLQPNGDTQRLGIERNIFVNQSKNIEITPGSVIFIPRELDNTAARRLSAQAYVSILGNIGIALASLSSIND